MIFRMINKDDNLDTIVNLMIQAGRRIQQDPIGFKKLVKRFYDNTLTEKDLELGLIYGLFDGNELIAVARIKQDEYTYYIASIQYIVIQENYRGKGIGTLFLNKLFDEIKNIHKKDFAALATGANTSAFYEKAGMKVFGKIIEETRKRHHLIKEL